jgi:hypothetical protein
MTLLPFAYLRQPRIYHARFVPESGPWRGYGLNGREAPTTDIANISLSVLIKF